MILAAAALMLRAWSDGLAVLVSAIYPAGGATGELLRRLVEREDVRSLAIPVAEETREDFTVLDRQERQAISLRLAWIAVARNRNGAPVWMLCKPWRPLPPFIVCSGSLPPGVPDDFYARVARFAKARGSKVDP